MEMKRILWPTDLSRNSAAALDYVAFFSRKLGAEVVLLYVAEDMRRFDHIYGDANAEFLRGLQTLEVKNAQERMERICQERLAGCLAFVREVAIGDPVVEILRIAKEKGVSLIIMATRGSRQDKGAAQFFGSVTDKVIRTSPVPVLVINKGQPTG